MNPKYTLSATTLSASPETSNMPRNRAPSLAAFRLAII
jgi:hypothetical protein